MSTYLGNQLLSGVATNTISNAHSLFDFKWTDHILNEMSWLRADTYSWHNGLLYKAAYNHLVEDVNGKSADNSDTIGSYTIWYVLADDGHKIVGPDQEVTANNIYNESGVSWYYILDTANQRFKLPRTKYGFVGLRDTVGKYVPESLPNIKATFATPYTRDASPSDYFSGCVSQGEAIKIAVNAGQGKNFKSVLNASVSSSAYQDNAPVQQRATQMYLYFYVGEYSQSQAEQVATLNVDLFNNKADKDLVNTGYLTNCITEVPQDVKLELNSGVLTLKEGSKVYVPNGFETDGTTPHFDVVTISSDISNNTSGASQMFMTYCNGTSKYLFAGFMNGGTVATRPNNPEAYALYYITSTNTIEEYNNGAWHSGYSLPIGIATRTSTNFSSIDQTFNGFGYIGSTIFALPGVKGLCPNGRNTDGSLKSIEFTVSNVLTETNNSGNDNIYVTINSDASALNRRTYTTFVYDEENNINYYNGSKYTETPICWHSRTSGVVSNFNPKTVFHAVDWNDKGTIAGLGMPSDRYISLTLGASGASYTAPANGYFAFFSSNITNSTFYSSNGYFRSTVIGASGYANGNIFPVKRGDIVYLSYGTSSGSTIRFYYAEGEV